MTRETASDTIRFGSDLVEQLLPHRRPLLMVDGVSRFQVDPARLCAYRMISGNEEVFAGHFPGLKLWPGAYTLEGLAQSCNLLAILEELRRRWLLTGNEERALVHAIRAIDLAYHMRPVGKLGDVDRLRELVGDARGCMGVVAAYDVKLIAPVFAGQRLDYEVVREPAVMGMLPFAATATVEGNVVARGVVTVALMDAAWQR